MLLPFALEYTCILALSVRLIVMTHDATLGYVNVCMCMLLFFVCFLTLAALLLLLLCSGHHFA